MMPLTEATKAVVLAALEGQRALLETLSDLGEDENAGLTAIDGAITEVKAAGEWRPVSEKFILTHDTGLVNRPKLFVRWNADDECVLVGKDDGSFYHCPLPPHIRLCEYIGSQEATQDGTNEQ